MEHQFHCHCLSLPTWMMKVCTSNDQCHPNCPRYRTFTLAHLSPSVDSAHLSPGQKTWLTLEWSGYHFAFEVCNQTEELSHLVHRPPLYTNGVRLYSLAHPSRPVAYRWAEELSGRWWFCDFVPCTRHGNAVDKFYSALVCGVLRNSIFPLKWTTHPHDVSGNGPCLPR